jgi:hypothetical protein
MKYREIIELKLRKARESEKGQVRRVARNTSRKIRPRAEKLGRVLGWIKSIG